jgi:hypothetical protein
VSRFFVMWCSDEVVSVRTSSCGPHCAVVINPHVDVSPVATRFSSDEIDAKVNALRDQLLAQYHELVFSRYVHCHKPQHAPLRPRRSDTHTLAAANDKKNEDAKIAFNISDDYKPGVSTTPLCALLSCPSPRVFVRQGVS